MQCPYCGKEIVTPVYAEPANAVGQPALTLFTNNACAAQPYPIITNGNGILWTNTVCAQGAAQPGITHYITLGDNDKR